MTKSRDSASYRAYQIIKARIIRNEFDPRQKLNEIDLAKDLALSRTPIREALIMLEKDGLISRYEHRKGFVLKRYSLQDIYDLYEFREVLELALASDLVKNVTDQDVEELGGILSQVDGLVKQNRPADALVKALDFHRCCIQICTNNSFIIDSLSICYEKLIVISWTCQDTNACVSSAKEHEKMLDALKAHDVDVFIKFTRVHIVGARDRIMNTLKMNGQKLYFLP
ncbi:MAG: GntR family transcriptional regulator [Deltaproteobacteria bacterium]|nr:GntR family transcriptional regulator [Deltaproteobacteria bacterium]